MKFSHFDVVPHEQNGQLMFNYMGGGGRYLGAEEREMWEMIQALGAKITELESSKRKKRDVIENETV